MHQPHHRHSDGRFCRLLHLFGVFFSVVLLCVSFVPSFRQRPPTYTPNGFDRTSSRNRCDPHSTIYRSRWRCDLRPTRPHVPIGRRALRTISRSQPRSHRTICGDRGCDHIQTAGSERIAELKAMSKDELQAVCRQQVRARVPAIDAAAIVRAKSARSGSRLKRSLKRRSW